MNEVEKVNAIFRYAGEEAVKTGWTTITVEMRHAASWKRTDCPFNASRP